MRALRATVTLLLDPRVIGPDAETEWTSDASASDFLSENLSDAVRETVLDWAYVGAEPHWLEVEIDPATYEEGQAVVLAPNPRAQEVKEQRPVDDGYWVVIYRDTLNVDIAALFDDEEIADRVAAALKERYDDAWVQWEPVDVDLSIIREMWPDIELAEEE